MSVLLIGSLSGVFFGWMMGFISLFLILLILIQRGKGGGLAGALGGPGGQSAFGSKAGDTFTWITVGAAVLWGILCVLAMITLGDSGANTFETPTTMKAGAGDANQGDGAAGPSLGDSEGLDLSTLGMGEAHQSENTGNREATPDAEASSSETPSADSPTSESSSGESSSGESESDASSPATTDSPSSP